jgi:hypothetical protein
MIGRFSICSAMSKEIKAEIKLMTPNRVGSLPGSGQSQTLAIGV